MFGPSLDQLANISAYARLINVSNSLLPNRTDNAVDIGLTPGQMLLSNKYGVRQITTTWRVFDDPQTKLDKIGQILDHNLGVLETPDQPGRYYQRVAASGANTLTRTAVTVDFTITFTCYDPYAYATDLVVATNNETDTLTITNPGSADTPVNLSATMVDDLGYLAATINGNGVSLGNPNGQAEAYGDVSTKMFETYFWTPYTLIQNKYPGKVSSTASLKGSWKQDSWKGVGFVYPDNYAEPSGASGEALFGTSFYAPFDKPRNHWAVNYHMLNYPLQNKVLGYTEMFAVDANGAPIFGYTFRKLNWSNKYQQLVLWVGDDVINTWSDAQNTSWIMEQFIGNVQLEQNGDAFTFRFRNDYTKAPWAKTLVYSNMANQKVAGINFYTGKFGGADGYYTHVMSMTGTSYDTNWVQTDNLFQAKSVVDINSDTAAPTVLVNGVPALDTMVPTSQPLIVPASSTVQINIDHTIGQRTPTVSAMMRPRYI